MTLRIIFYSLSLTLLSGVLVSCAHHRDVRAGEDGIHRVVVKSEDKDSGSRDAMSQADDFCKQFNKYPVYLNEESKYTGDMEEENYKTAKTASKVAKVAGGMTHVFGGRKESNIGGVVGLGGVVGDAVTGQGYTFQMRFKCK